jgi:hypothetical protein
MNRIERVCQTCGAMTDEYVIAYSKLDDEIVTCRDCARAVYRAYRGALEAELGLDETQRNVSVVVGRTYGNF